MGSKLFVLAVSVTVLAVGGLFIYWVSWRLLVGFDMGDEPLTPGRVAARWVMLGMAVFLVSLVASVAGLAVCAAGLVARLRDAGRRGAILALAGLGLSVIAAIAQQWRVAIHPVHFDHNATYHVLLLPALALLFGGFLHLGQVRAAARGAS